MLLLIRRKFGGLWKGEYAVYLTVLVLSVSNSIPIGIEENYAANAYDILTNLLTESAKNSPLIGNFAGLKSSKLLFSAWNSLHFIGAGLGTILTPCLCRSYGRVGTMLASTLLTALPGRFLHILSPEMIPRDWWLWILISRFLSGIHTGIINVAQPVHLTEIALPHQRGMIAIFVLFTLGLGGLLGAIFGYDSVFGGPKTWPYTFLVCFALSTVSLSLLWLPESATYLVLKDRKAAQESLRFYTESSSKKRQDMTAGDNDKEHPSRIECILQDATDYCARRDTDKRGSGSALRAIISYPSCRRGLFLSIAFSIMFVPMFIFVTFSTIIYESAVELPTAVAQFLSLILRISTILTTLVGIWLEARISTNRRKRLLATSSVGAVCLLLLSLTQFFYGTTILHFSEGGTILLRVIFIALTFIFTISIDLGTRSMYFAYVPELFPFQFRVFGKAVATTILMILIAVFISTFYALFTRFGWATYALVAVPYSLSLGYCYWQLPETDSLELCEIAAAAVGPSSVAETKPLTISCR